MTLVEKIKAKHPDYDVSFKFRGDGVLIIEIKKNERKVSKALKSIDMLKIIKNSESKAEEYLCEIVKGMVKEIEKN